MPNVTIKRYNGTTYDELYPKTKVSQVDGLLDENNKIKESWLPISVFGGLRKVAVISESITTLELANLVDVYVADNGGIPTSCYFVAGANITISPAANHYIQGEEGAGDTTQPVVLEKFDWILLDKIDGNDYYWSVINNTYPDASTTNKGVVQLATKTETRDNSISTKAVTPQGLDDFISYAIGEGNRLAPKSHNHQATSITQPTALPNVNIFANATVDSALVAIDEKIGVMYTTLGSHGSSISSLTSSISSINSTLSTHGTDIDNLESRIEVLYQDVANAPKVGDIIFEY